MVGFMRQLATEITSFGFTCANCSRVFAEDEAYFEGYDFDEDILEASGVRSYVEDRWGRDRTIEEKTFCRQCAEALDSEIRAVARSIEVQEDASGPFIRDDESDWRIYRGPNVLEEDFHVYSIPRWYREHYGGTEHAWWEKPTPDRIIEALNDAQSHGYDYVLLRHGSSTSGNGLMTTRRVVRATMRDDELHQLIVPEESVQHYSVFVAKVRRGQDT